MEEFYHSSEDFLKIWEGWFELKKKKIGGVYLVDEWVRRGKEEFEEVLDIKGVFQGERLIEV